MPPIKEDKSNKFKYTKFKSPMSEYPIWNCSDIPSNFGVYLILGSRTSGKTYSTSQLIKQMEDAGCIHPATKRRHPVRTIVISPTLEQNPTLDQLASLAEEDKHREYSDELIQDILQSIEDNKKECERYEEQMKIHKTLLRNRYKLDDLSDEFYLRCEMFGINSFHEPEKPTIHGKVAYPPPINNLVIDDMVGTEALKNGRNALNNLVLRNRHKCMNVMILSQGVKQIPKIIRNNANVFCIFKYANSKMIVNDFYEEVSNILTEDQFKELYEYATTPDESCPKPFLCIDWTKPKDRLFRKCFHRYLSFESDNEEEEI